MIAPAVDGTLNVLKACIEANVKRVVYVSSVAAAFMNPMWSKNQVLDEACWSDQEYCKKTEVNASSIPHLISLVIYHIFFLLTFKFLWQNWYCLAKTRAESEAFEFAKRTGLHLVSVCPTLVLGPILQQNTVNASSLVLLKLLKGIQQALSFTSGIVRSSVVYMGW